MQPGQAIEIQLVDSAGRLVRLGNVLAGITFFRGDYRRYNFDLRPTKLDGKILVDFDELEARRRELGLSSLMDYNDPLTRLDRCIEISLPSESQLQERLRAIEVWDHWCRPAWTLKWPVNGSLAAVPPVRATLDGPLTHVNIVVSLPY